MAPVGQAAMQRSQVPHRTGAGASGARSTSRMSSPRSSHGPWAGEMRQADFPAHPIPARAASARSRTGSASTATRPRHGTNARTRSRRSRSFARISPWYSGQAAYRATRPSPAPGRAAPAPAYHPAAMTLRAPGRSAAGSSRTAAFSIHGIPAWNPCASQRRNAAPSASGRASVIPTAANPRAAASALTRRERSAGEGLRTRGRPRTSGRCQAPPSGSTRTTPGCR
jgi:hypothetical protein